MKKLLKKILDFVERYQLFIILFLAIALRVFYYLRNPSIYLDEARTWAYLNDVISWNPSVTWPIGQLWLQRIVTTVFGSHEYVLRFIPLLSSIGTVFLSYKVIRLWFDKKVAFATSLLLAVSPTAIQFAVEFKQYSLDLFLATGYLYLMSLIVKGAKLSWKKLALLFAISTIGLTLSNTLIFIIPTTFLLFLIKTKFKRDKKFYFVTASVILSLITFLLLYYFFISRNTGENRLVEYWNEYYMPLHPVKLVNWIFWVIPDIARNTLGFKSILRFLGAFLIIVGFVKLVIDKKYIEFLLFIGPIFLVLGASVLHKYPFGNRLLTFLLPSFYLLLGYSLTFLRKKKVLFYISSALLALMLLAVTTQHMENVVFRQHLRPLISRMKEEYQQDTPIIVFGKSKNAWYYYNERFDFNKKNYLVLGSDSGPEAFREEINKANGTTWFIWSHVLDKDSDEFISEFKEKGEILENYYFEKDSSTRVLLFKPYSEDI